MVSTDSAGNWTLTGQTCLGDDEVVAKAAAEDVWTRGKRALLALGHREPVEAPAKQDDDESFLERIRGAGKRLVG